MEERTLRSRRIYEGRILNLRVDTVALPRGGTSTRVIVEHGDAVCMVPVDSEGNVLLVRQYRKAVGEELLEVPAGGVEEGESPEETAVRELQEETGFAPGRLEKLAFFWMAPGYSSEGMHAYLATDLAPGSLTQEEDEDVRVERYPLARVPDLIASGQVRDAKSIASLLLALRRLAGL